MSTISPKEMKFIEASHKKLNKGLRSLVRKLLKSDNVASILDDLRVHFRRKDAWPLSYHIYLSTSKLNAVLFDQLLYMKKYKVVARDGTLLIIKGK